MKPIHVGLVADPAAPTEVANRISDLDPPGRDDHKAWDIEVVSEPFTAGCEDLDTAVGRLGDQARQHDWDLVVGLTGLPLRDDDGRYLLVEADPQRRTAVLSLPALGGLRALVGGMADPSSQDEHRVPLPRLGGRSRLLRGMVLANRPWRLVPGLKSVLAVAPATGAVATIASIALVVAWLVIDGELWDRPDDSSSEARERSRLYNTSTLLTLTAPGCSSAISRSMS